MVLRATVLRPTVLRAAALRAEGRSARSPGRDETAGRADGLEAACTDPRAGHHYIQRLPASSTRAELASAPRARRTRHACAFNANFMTYLSSSSPGCEPRPPSGAGAMVNRARSAFTSSPLSGLAMRHRRPGGLPSPLDRRSLALRPRLATGVPWTVLHREAKPLPDTDGSPGDRADHMTHWYQPGRSGDVGVRRRTSGSRRHRQPPVAGPGASPDPSGDERRRYPRGIGIGGRAIDARRVVGRLTAERSETTGR